MRAFFLIVVFLAPLHAQATELADAIGRMSQSMARISGDTPTLAQAYKEALASGMIKARQALDASNTVPEEYAQLINFLAEQLNQAVELKSDEQKKEVVVNVTEELKALRYSLGISAVGPGLVRVSISTERNSAPVHGFRISCNPRRFANASTRRFIFNALSSPTTRDMPPGTYRFFIENTAGEVLASPDHQVGLDGKDTADVSVGVK